MQDSKKLNFLFQWGLFNIGFWGELLWYEM